MRLIDADALKEEVNKKKVVGRFNTLLLIDNAPTVEERPQGEWIRKPNEHRVDIICTNCGYDDGYSCFKYCPNCGADMKGGTE